MTLIDLVNKYRGEARFDVNVIKDDAAEDVVAFLTDEADAIKDAILNAEVSRFKVTEIDKTGLPTLTVLVKEAETEPEKPDGPPENESEKNK